MHNRKLVIICREITQAAQVQFIIDDSCVAVCNMTPHTRLNLLLPHLAADTFTAGGSNSAKVTKPKDPTKPHFNILYLVSLLFAPPVLYTTNHFLDREVFDLLVVLCLAINPIYRHSRDSSISSGHREFSIPGTAEAELISLY